MIAAVSLLLLGTFYSQQVNAVFSLPADVAFEFVKLAFFWSVIFGASGIVAFIFGLVQRSTTADRFTLGPTLFLLVFLLSVFFVLFYRTLSSPQAIKPLKPGETLLI